MSQVDVQLLRAAKRFAKQDYDKQVTQQAGAGGAGFDAAGPPTWDRAAWEAFKSQYGFYPFGMQDGAFVAPPTYAGAPDWVYELMNLRKPPVTVSPENAY
jgi:hypothetical protein